MVFEPNKHILDLRGKKYLEVKWRLVWFRESQPHGRIDTQVLSFDPLVVKATVSNSDGVIIASGHGSADAGNRRVVWSGREIEKAETAAIGRALAHAGYGTQFTSEDEAGYLADSPVNGQQQPPPLVEPHWTTVTERVIKFRRWASDQGLSQDDMRDALKINSLADYGGSPADAMQAVEEYVNNRAQYADDAPDGQNPLSQNMPDTRGQNPYTEENA